MNKEFTNEDIINAAKHCATNADCDNCPFFATLEIEGCIETFTRYIVNNTKNEPVPTADVQEVKHGDWLKPGNDPIDNKQWICSECKGLTETAYYCGHCYYNYCPNCGTRMDGDSL